MLSRFLTPYYRTQLSYLLGKLCRGLKTSVRDEFDRLGSDFDRLSDEKNISSETKVLMRSMLTLLELILAILLPELATSLHHIVQAVDSL
ncbi:MAG: hypothetical protein OFPII_41660 [Osedax symbiont Rs1]|nr:MAG: hypothetical protein OFPII_41660 [Osedax symbiont Rs1]